MILIFGNLSQGLAEKAERMEKFIQNFYAQLMADCKNPEEIIKIKAYLEYRKQLYVVLNNGGPKEDVAKIHEEFYDTLAKPFQATKPGLYNIEGEGRLIYVMYNELHNFMFSILSSEY